MDSIVASAHRSYLNAVFHLHISNISTPNGGVYSEEVELTSIKEAAGEVRPTTLKRICQIQCVRLGKGPSEQPQEGSMLTKRCTKCRDERASAGILSRTYGRKRSMIPRTIVIPWGCSKSLITTGYDGIPSGCVDPHQ